MVKRFFLWLIDKLDSRPAVVKQIYRQGFVSVEDLNQMLELNASIGSEYKRLHAHCEKHIDVYTFIYVLHALTGVKLEDLK